MAVEDDLEFEKAQSIHAASGSNGIQADPVNGTRIDQVYDNNE